jgi:dCMP deaminase
VAVSAKIIQIGQFILITIGMCVGKSTIANFLVNELGFTRLYLERGETGQAKDHGLERVKSSKDEFFTFNDPEALLDHVTAKWQHNWVTTDVDSLEVVESYAKRPFFLLVSVDAPILCRFERYTKRLVKLRFKLSEIFCI